MLNRMIRPLLSVLGIACLSAVLLSLTSRPVPAQFAPPIVPVKVTNTPLPVIGNVNASQSGAWSVGVNNLPAVQSVNFNGAQPVSFSNTPSTPLFNRDVDNPARLPLFGACDLVQVSGPTFQSCDVHFATNAPGFTGFIQIPSGYRLVIEYVYGELDLATASGQPLIFGVKTSLGPAPNFSFTNINFDMRLTGTIFGQDIYKASQQTRIYEDAGATVSLGVLMPYPVQYSASLQVTGYLVSE